MRLARTHPAASAPGPSAERRRGQVAVLLLLLTLALTPLLGLLLNVSNAVEQRQRAQEAADRATIASAGVAARGLNVVSNTNLAILELTALITAIDSVAPTVRKARTTLNAERVAAALIPGAQPVLIKLQQEAMLLNLFSTVGKLGRALRPMLVSLRSGLSTLQGATLRPLPNLALAAGLSAGSSVGAGIHVVPEVELGPRWEEVRMAHYDERAWDEHDALAKPVFWVLLIGATVSGAAGYWEYESNKRFREAIQRPPTVMALTHERGEVTQARADAQFVCAWRAHGSGRDWFLGSVFGDGGPSCEAIAEGLVFNGDTWDLLTPRWEAALVPVRVADAGGAFEVQH